MTNFDISKGRYIFCIVVVGIIRIRVDYSTLSDELKELEEADEIKRKGDRLQKAINTLQNTVDKIQAPNMRVRVALLHIHTDAQCQWKSL